jgi:purine-nucleoside phosphorylase
MSGLKQAVESAVKFIRTKATSSPQVGLVLGSGQKKIADRLENVQSIAFNEIPGFSASAVAGEEAFVFGSYDGIPVVVLCGKLQYENGYTQTEVALPICVMKELGIKTLVLTCISEGVNSELKRNSVMLVADHINFSGDSPLIGSNLDDFGPGFPDATDIYSSELRNQLKDVASKEGIALSEGVLIMYSGADHKNIDKVKDLDRVEFLRTTGADAVGNSLVPDALVACRCGIKVIGLSVIADMASNKAMTINQGAFCVADEIDTDFTKLVYSALKVAI